jgi:O-antigen/teichoic acid export membrane protein
MSPNKISLRIKEQIKSDFRKNLLVMIGGSSIAQAIPILFSILLTRLYTPEEFGEFSNFLAWLSFLLVFMTLKYEMAIILPKKKLIAINLVVLCLIISLFFFVLSSVVVVFLNNLNSSVLNRNDTKSFLLYIPLAGLSVSLFNIVNEWLIREKKFNNIITYNIANNLSIAGISALLPNLTNEGLGLIKGRILGQSISLVFGLRFILKNNGIFFYKINKRLIKYVFLKYINFARFNIPGQLLNNLAAQVVVLYLTFQFGLKAVGLYALTDRCLGVPLNFLGNAIRDVFKQRAAEDYKSKGECSEVYKKTTLLLTFCSLPICVVAFNFFPSIFLFFFGSEWKASGSLAQTLCIMYFLSFITNPTGWLFVIAEKQKMDFLWQTLFLILTVISLGLSYVFKNRDLYGTLLFFSIGRSIAYLIQMIMTYKIATGRTSGS